MFFAFDFDGTIVDNKYPEIGDVNKEVVRYMRKVWGNYLNVIIIWTCRSGDSLDQMREFLIKNRVPFDFINENPIFDLGGRKIFAHAYLQSRNIWLQNWDQKLR